jgi:hypothetical protein
MHLNGWQRIGIVASVLWAIGGGFWGNNIRIHEGDWVWQEYQFCIEHADAKAENSASSLQAASEDVAKKLDACDKARDKSWPAAISYHWVYGAFFGLVPILLGWLTAYGIIALLRWIRAGFKVSTSPN